MLKTVWLKVKDSKIFWVILVGLALFCAGFVSGRNHKVPVQIVERTIEDTISKQKLQEAFKTVSVLQEQLTVMQSKYEEARLHVKTIVHIVKQKDGTTIIDKTTELDSNKKASENTKASDTKNETKVATGEKKSETDTSTHKDVSKTTTPVSKPWFVGPIITFVPTASVGQQFMAGLIFGRQLGTIPLLNVPVSAAVTVAVPTYKPINLPSIGATITVGF